jgi:hypothetical protein
MSWSLCCGVAKSLSFTVLTILDTHHLSKKYYNIKCGAYQWNQFRKKGVPHSSPYLKVGASCGTFGD